jgi:hypothetical protein
MNESTPQIRQSGFPLTALCLRFACRAVSDLDLGGLRAGMRLRGALLNVMNRSICALSPFAPAERLRMDPQHVQNCPVCWLQLYEPRPGEVRRAYVLQPPIHLPARLPAGTPFSFVFTLLGEGQNYLPYFLLAVREMGEVGVGKGRGRFQLQQAFAEYPDGQSAVVWSEDEPVVRLPQRRIEHRDAAEWAQRMKERLNGAESLTLSFPTPLRIVNEDRLLKTPRFEAVFDALLKRLDDLAEAYAGGYQRAYDERVRLRQLARQVQLVENHTEWVELSSSSSRSGRETWISGLVGRAVYQAPVEVWQALGEWLAWAEIVQVGKDTVKGNGVVRVGGFAVGG